MAKLTIDDFAFSKSVEETTKRIDSACEKSVKETCEDIQRMAKQFAPVRSGKLRDSIKIKVDGLKGEVYSGEVYSDVSYAGYVENGTRKMRARPFLRPAYDACIKELMSRVVKNL